MFTCAETVPLFRHIVSRYHIHNKLVLIARTTLLKSFNIHWLFIFPNNEQIGKKYSTTDPSHCMSSSYVQSIVLIFERYTTT